MRVTTVALPPACATTPFSQSSTSPPERITTFAVATASASLGRGSYSCGSEPGLRIWSTCTRSPATARAISATCVVVATTAGLSSPAPESRQPARRRSGNEG